jgi:ubiquinone/menaquinone biosynthesis C-methylase UbiE
MLSAVARYIPQPMKRPLRSVFFVAADLLDALPGKRDQLVPPRYLRDYIGEGDFHEIGQQFLRYHIDVADLRPNERVLDVGCGIGRMAAALTGYLNDKGSYDGFDIVKRGIVWCTRHITRKHSNFRFAHSDVYNRAFNPTGKIPAREYRFSYADASFDYVFAYSVFTHMIKGDLENYLKEIARVLKPGGRCLITYFLLNVESLDSIAGRTSSFDFKPYSKESRSISLETPEFAIAYDERFITDLYGKHRLHIRDPVHFGSWPNRSGCLDFQDIVVAVKE